ncbi:hypothetical protein OG395_08360 [Streptomyces sp. NBC_01320]|nr:hypothetical protein OG395_08360 [Streptomyces sp. NBC_01320]
MASAEPKELRYRLLHAAARITRGGRRLHLRIAAGRPWRHELAHSCARLAALSRPATRPTATAPAHPRPEEPGEPDLSAGPPAMRTPPTATALHRQPSSSDPTEMGRLGDVPSSTAGARRQLRHLAALSERPNTSSIRKLLRLAMRRI